MTSNTQVRASSQSTAQTEPEPNASEIRRHFERVCDCAKRALKGKRHDDFCLVLSSLGRGAPIAKRFSVGDVEGLTRTAQDWTKMKGSVVCMAPVVYERSKLPRREAHRGGADAIAFVLGLVADVDHDNGQDPECVCHLKPRPTLTIATSHRNRCPMYLFECALAFDEAKQLALRLANFVSDNDRSTADPNHPWRIPGTLNWLSKVKAQRRGIDWPCPPELVAIDADTSSFKLVSAADLNAFLEIDAERVENETRQENPLHFLGSKGPIRPGHDIWNGDEREDARFLMALRCLDKAAASGNRVERNGRVYDMATRHTWLWVGMVIFIWHQGSAHGFAVWRAVANGSGEFNFVGAPGRWDEDDSERVWRSFKGDTETTELEAKLVKAGTMFQMAAECCGFDLRRGLIGLAPLPGREPILQPEVLRVVEAGREFHSLRNRGGRDLRDEAIRALRRYAHSITTPGRAMKVLDCIADDIHRGDHPTCAGCAWRSVKEMCAALSTNIVTWDRRDLHAAVQQLISRRLLAASRGTLISVAGRKGPTYALTPPAHYDWEELIEAFRVRRGHGRSTSRVLRLGADHPIQGRETDPNQGREIYRHADRSHPIQGRESARPSTTTLTSTRGETKETVANPASERASLGDRIERFAAEGAIADDVALIVERAIQQKADNAGVRHLLDVVGFARDAGTTPVQVHDALFEAHRRASFAGPGNPDRDLASERPSAALKRLRDKLLVVLSDKYGLRHSDLPAFDGRKDDARGPAFGASSRGTSAGASAEAPPRPGAGESRQGDAGTTRDAEVSPSLEPLHIVEEVSVHERKGVPPPATTGAAVAALQDRCAPFMNSVAAGLDRDAVFRQLQSHHTRIKRDLKVGDDGATDMLMACVAETENGLPRVRAPLAYLKTLVDKTIEGTFVPTGSTDDVRRKVSAATVKAAALSLAASELQQSSKR